MTKLNKQTINPNCAKPQLGAVFINSKVISPPILKRENLICFTMTNFKISQKIYFKDEKLPFKVMAFSKNYVVVSRKLHRRQDAELLHHEVKNGAYSSFTDVYNNFKDAAVYSILDLKNKVRASDNLIFGIYDYGLESDCKKAIKALEQDEIQLSHKTKVDLNIDFERNTL